jgi:hypothetical protein
VSPAALLDELVDTGATLSLTGDCLHYQTRLGVSIVPYADRIGDANPVLLALLHLQD